MNLKYISWLFVFASLVGTIAYFGVYDRMTRSPLKVLFVDSPYARDLRNILDEFTDRTNVSVQVDSVPRELYREAVTRDLDTDEQTYDIVIGENSWELQDIDRNYYADISDIIKASWLFKTHSPATDGNLFVVKNGSYYGMPIALDVFGVRDSVPYTPNMSTDFENAMLTDTKTEGELTHTFLALLLAKGGMFVDNDGKVSKTGLMSKTAQDVLETIRTMNGGATLLVGRTEHLRKQGDIQTVYHPLPGESSKAYAITYLAHKVKGGQNPRAADSFLAWMGSKQANVFMQEENGTSLVEKVRDESLAKSYSVTRPVGTVPVQFFVTPQAVEMLHLADTYIAAYRNNTMKFTAQETLETIATAWEKALVAQ